MSTISSPTILWDFILSMVLKVESRTITYAEVWKWETCFPSKMWAFLARYIPRALEKGLPWGFSIPFQWTIHGNFHLMTFSSKGFGVPRELSRIRGYPEVFCSLLVNHSLKFSFSDPFFQRFWVPRELKIHTNLHRKGASHEEVSFCFLTFYAQRELHKSYFAMFL